LWSVPGQQWANATVEVFFCGPIPGSEGMMLARGVRKPARAMPGISASHIYKSKSMFVGVVGTCLFVWLRIFVFLSVRSEEP
jgi:hypothetical protein